MKDLRDTRTEEQRFLSGDFSVLDKYSKGCFAYISEVINSYLSPSDTHHGPYLSCTNSHRVTIDRTIYNSGQEFLELLNSFPPKERLSGVEKIFSDLKQIDKNLLSTQNLKGINADSSLFFTIWCILSDICGHLGAYSAAEKKPERIIEMLNENKLSHLDKWLGLYGGRAPPAERFILRKEYFLDNAYKWWQQNKIKELSWLPIDACSTDDAEWAWNALKKIQGKYKINPASPMNIFNSFSIDIIEKLEQRCAGQYQLAVYSYFLFINGLGAKEAVRNALSDGHRARVHKQKNKGRVLNINLSEEVKKKLDVLTKHEGRRQADVISELINAAYEKRQFDQY